VDQFTREKNVAGLPGLPRLLSESEAAEYLGVTELTLYRWRKRGLIACIMVGKSPRYTEQHIADYLVAQEVPAVPVAESKPKPVRHGPRRSRDEPNALLLAHQILTAAKARREGR
jgi:excisionase family DNA binding protein